MSGWYHRRYADLMGERLTLPPPGRNVLRQISFFALAWPLSLVTFVIVVGCWAFAVMGFAWLAFGWSRHDALLPYGDPVAMSVTPVVSTILVILAVVLAVRLSSLELSLARSLL